MPQPNRKSIEKYHPALCLLAGMMMAAAPLQASPAQPRQEAIAARGSLQVCIWPAYYGITFRNPRDNVLRGIDIDLARAFAADLKVEVAFVDTSFATFMDDLDQGKCDVAMFGIGQTDARRARVDLSVPHLRSGIYAITTKTSALVKSWADLDKPGHVIAVQAGTVMEPFAKENLRQAKVTVVSPPATRENEVLAGRADAFLTDYPYSLRMRYQHDWAAVIASPTPVGVTDYGFAVKKGQPDWLARVDAFVTAVKKDGRLKSAAAAHEMTPIALLE